MRPTAYGLLSALLLTALPVAGNASTWDMDPVHSEVGFKVKHMMVTNVRGSFRTFKAVLDLDEADVSRSKLDVSIQADSVDTGVEKRDTHLKSADFFDAAKFPTLTFRSKSVRRVSDDLLKVTGELTIRGVTREVVLDVDGPTNPIKDAAGKTRLGASAVTKINRKDYGLNWNKALEAGGVVVGEEVGIQLEASFVKR